jgi:LysM repeat protein
VIALINGYRAENGLPAYAQNPILMMTAQGQADWLVSQPMGSVGDVHAGPNGSRPRDRAYAAGYGGGNTIFISEIVKGGYNETPQDALNWWKQSPDHHPTLIASTYQEIGAGAATDGNGRWWYVAVTGWITGVTYTPPEGESDSGSATTGQAVMIPVTVAEPQPDGSVVHIIRTGQTLWTIAAVYGVPLEQILELNDMPEWAFVRPGDEILVKPAGSAVTATPTTGAEQPTPTITRTPTVDLTPAATRTSAVANLPTSPASGNLGGDARIEQANSTVRMIVVITLVSIVLVIAASFFIRPGQTPEPEDDFDPFAPIE